MVKTTLLPEKKEQISSSKEKKTQVFWKNRMERVGVGRSYEEMKTAFDSESPSIQHAAAHMFGELLYKTEGIRGIGICDDTFTFGCYHGFFTLAIRHEGWAGIPQLFHACNDIWKEKSLPCVHGLGHGILLSEGYDNLVGALGRCSQFPPDAATSCQSGVFMENNFRTMEATESMGMVPVRKGREQPFEPCASLPDEFAHQCFFEQVQWWESIYDGNYETILSRCESLGSSEARKGCFEGVGNIAAMYSHFDVQKTMDICARIIHAGERVWCREAAARVTLFQGKNQTAAISLCAADEAEKKSCVDMLKNEPYWE